MKYSQLSLLLFIIFSIKANAVEDVNSQALSKLSVLQNYHYPASVVALNKITLSSEMSGIVQSNTVLIGTKVQAGKTIVQINCTDNLLAKEQGLAALKRLQVQKKLALQQLKRAQQLVRVKSISKQELDQKQTALDADIASLEQQRVALKIIDHNITKCRVKAPFTGIITDYMANKSTFVTPGAPLFSIIDPTSVEIKTSLPLNLAAQLKTINDISFKQNNITYPLTIRALLPDIDLATKQQKIRLSITNKQLPLANSIGRIVWDSQQRFIPSQYVVTRNSQLGIFIVQAGKAVFHPLKHAIEGQKSPINLPPQTSVITNKLLILNHNDVIN